MPDGGPDGQSTIVKRMALEQLTERASNSIRERDKVLRDEQQAKKVKMAAGMKRYVGEGEDQGLPSLLYAMMKTVYASAAMDNG